MTFSINNLDVFLAVLVRITAFIYVAPFFNLRNVPMKVKAGFSFFLSFIIFNLNPEQALNYQDTFAFASTLISEALVGLIIGFFTNISYYIITFAGRFMDMEIGFSMVNEFDPISSIQTTISSNYYSYLVMLMMLVTNLHHYILLALADTFKIIPLGGANFKSDMYLIMLDFMRDYFIIGFRIVLPVFAAFLIVSTILAILAKIAPQMNMFVIGLQLKVFVGLLVLMLLTTFVYVVSEYIFDEMIFMMKRAIEALS